MNDCEVEAHLAVVRLTDICGVEVVDVRAGVVDRRLLREPWDEDADEAAVLRSVEEKAQVQSSLADGAAPMNEHVGPRRLARLRRATGGARQLSRLCAVEVGVQARDDPESRLRVRCEVPPRRRLCPRL